MQEFLPPHVQQAIDEAWAVNLEQQAEAWKVARSRQRTVNSVGVLVVRRPARRSLFRPLSERSVKTAWAIDQRAL